MSGTGPSWGTGDSAAVSFNLVAGVASFLLPTGVCGIASRSFYCRTGGVGKTDAGAALARCVLHAPAALDGCACVRLRVFGSEKDILPVRQVCSRDRVRGRVCRL